MKKITVYSTNTCPYCRMLTAWLKDKQIDYTEYKVDENPFAAQHMVNLSGQMGVPFTTIEDEDGSMEKILGFDRTQKSLDIDRIGGDRINIIILCKFFRIICCFGNIGFRPIGIS